jgi:hypothetical protein
MYDLVVIAVIGLIAALVTIHLVNIRANVHNTLALFRNGHPSTKHHILRDVVDISVRPNYIHEQKMIHGGRRLITKNEQYCMTCNKWIEKNNRRLVYNNGSKCYPCYRKEDVTNAHCTLFMLLRCMEGVESVQDLVYDIIRLVVIFPIQEVVYESCVFICGSGNDSDEWFYTHMINIPTLPMPIIRSDYLVWNIEFDYVTYHILTLTKDCKLFHTVSESKDKPIPINSIKEGLLYIDSVIKEEWEKYGH